MNIQIQESGEEVIILKQSSHWLDESEQREIVSWLWKHKSQMVRDIVCEECAEHIGEMERKDYVLNECERGHKP